MPEQPELDPSFQCIRGAYSHYSQHTGRVTKANLRAFFEEMQATDCLFDRTEDLTWDEVWKTVNDYQVWWCRHYAAREVRVAVKYLPEKTWPEYLAEKKANEQKLLEKRSPKR